ncbi:NYN domain-containing protein [Lusitaniella coriacea LEGE 07157]|uniref:NYN domain-containing protein n=1 Tax=Lusitaniella coriacea LEGE 07157 TaxID=945747 RepID=A0A8J7DWU8_9CYAN|nr:NYN domain-containing protein [Lusitaniella coriacea]MBE9116707.1 NYN domain-containing protein [Lusitaniella coriacea LEGE 07157]
MRFDTAIFYDIENLLGGYNFSEDIMRNLSLKEILNKIRQTGIVEEIAVQRAYANWSDPRLKKMRKEINELGIEPIQVFGFSNHKKNAADIQLAVEAVDIAYIRPALKKFVIVSGDGGFASLAKKLHEFGKTVIGCAYDDATNNVFRSVCDVFVEIHGFEEDNTFNITNPQAKELARSIEPLEINSTEEFIDRSKNIIRWFESDPNARKNLKNTGISLSTIKEAFTYGIINFEGQHRKLGFNKFIEFLQYICADTKLCIFSHKSEAKLGLIDNPLPGFTALPNLELRKIHSIENYLSILATGKPYLRTPDNIQEMRAVTSCLAEIDLKEGNLGDFIETIKFRLNETISSESIKLSLLSFIAVGIFEQQPETAKLSEQTLRLKDEFNSSEAFISTFKKAAIQKIETFLDEKAQSELIEQIFEAPQQS